MLALQPSREDVKRTLPLREYADAVTAEVCSVKVAMWKARIDVPYLDQAII